jgi:hypothetical protein
LKGRLIVDLTDLANELVLVGKEQFPEASQEQHDVLRDYILYDGFTRHLVWSGVQELYGATREQANRFTDVLWDFPAYNV